MPGINSLIRSRLLNAGKPVLWVFLFAAAFSACGDNKTPVVTDSPAVTWISGGDTIGQSGVYGTLGVVDAANVPGSRHQSASWRDADGRFWLFGGSGLDAAGGTGHLNDLWRFDPATLEWVWIAGSNTAIQPGLYGTLGSPSSSNIPGSRDASVSWIDASGMLWLFGGHGHDSISDIGQLNDLWKFDPATLEWTWVAGSNMINRDGVYGTLGTAAPSNIPGARQAAVGWLDANGVFWLFGGYGADAEGSIGYLNDLWKFNPSTLEWTWVAGSDTVNEKGVYGDQNQAASDNVPGSRDASVAWIDAGGTLWLFGGYGFDYAGYLGQLNDLWKFNPSTLQWTWVSGGKKYNRYGHYGVQNEADSSNVPGGRNLAVSWLDADGNFWLFGGNGIETTGDLGHLNDLWKFDPTSRDWTWVAGGTTINPSGVYGTKGTADAANIPGGREAAVPWIDASGALWLFGGWGFDASGNPGELNDLWRFAW